MTARWIGRRDSIQRHVRLWRFTWRRGAVGLGTGYSVKLAIGLTPVLWRYRRDARFDHELIVLGIRIHYSRSYGGIFAA